MLTGTTNEATVGARNFQSPPICLLGRVVESETELLPCCCCPGTFRPPVADIPNLPVSVSIVSYADVLTINSQHPRHPTAAQQLLGYLPELKLLLSNNVLHISTPKSIITLLTPFNKEILDHHRALLDCALLPLITNHEIQRMILDSLTYSRQV